MLKIALCANIRYNIYMSHEDVYPLEIIYPPYDISEVINSRHDIPEDTDLIVVLGKNLGVNWDRDKVQRSPDLLSVDSSVNTLAAGELYQPGRKILLSGGKTIGKGFPSQPEAAKKYLMKKYPNIPEEDILIDDTGFDTAASAETLANMAKDLGYKHIALLSVGYHQAYAPLLFRQYGAPIESVIASEDILAERSKYFNDFVTAWKGLNRIRQEEAFSRKRTYQVQTTDKKGILTRKRTQSRVEE